MDILLKYFSDFTPKQIEQFKALDALYREWNAKINVISRKDIDSLYEKHVLHSLSIGAVFDFPAGSEIAAQVDGAVAMGLSAMLYNEITINKGRVVETNFDSYRILQLREMPKIQSVLAPTYDFWGGVGEPTICVISPAVMNAIFAATGKPVRSLPLKNMKVV